MRIGIDMIGELDPGAAGRGIGRYTGSFVEALVRFGPGHEYILYYYDGNGSAPQNPPAGARVQLLPARKAPPTQAAQDLVDRNPDHLDLYLVTSPFTRHMHYLPPGKSIQGPRLAAVLYDLIPILTDRDYYFQRHVKLLHRHYERLHRLKQYDHLLAISDATRQDAVIHLGVPESRVVNISAATRDAFFAPPRSGELPDCLRTLGIRKPFVLSVSGGDRRKNADGLIRAFARLTAPLRASHQLVVMCSLAEEAIQTLTDLAHHHGVGDRLVLTNQVTDEQLHAGYQHCATMAFTSHAEGFGLPILEAMLCGAPVLAGDNSSQPEVVGDAGLLARTTDEADMAAKLDRLLTDSALAADLRRRGPEQASRFTWQETARRAHQALQSAWPARRRKPLLAFFSQLPPQRTGVADYALSLLEELKQYYTIHLYHDAGQFPHVSLTDLGLAGYDYRLFEDQNRLWDYHAILYQMGNSEYHAYIYETMLRHPGVVTMHDLRLVRFHGWYGDQLGNAQRYLEREIAFSRPDLSPEEQQRIATSAHREWYLSEPHPEIRDLDLSLRVFAQAQQVIIHDDGMAERYRTILPAYRDRIHTIPIGATTAVVSEEERRALRTAYGLPRDALIVGTFGFVSESKFHRETVKAFLPLAWGRPDAVLLFAGEEMERGVTRKTTEIWGLSGQVRFLGYQTPEDFPRLMRTVDLAVNLRRPPTNGESSGSLLRLLGLGVPVIVTDCGTFSSFPDDVVYKVTPDERLLDRLADALLLLGKDEALRRRLRDRALAYMETCTWPQVAEKYVAVIEQAAAMRRRCKGPIQPEAASRLPLAA